MIDHYIFIGFVPNFYHFMVDDHPICHPHGKVSWWPPSSRPGPRAAIVSWPVPFGTPAYPVEAVGQGLDIPEEDVGGKFSCYWLLYIYIYYILYIYIYIFMLYIYLDIHIMYGINNVLYIVNFVLFFCIGVYIFIYMCIISVRVCVCFCL